MHHLLTLLDDRTVEESCLEKTQGNVNSFAARGSLTKGRLTGAGTGVIGRNHKSDKLTDTAGERGIIQDGFRFHSRTDASQSRQVETGWQVCM